MLAVMGAVALLVYGRFSTGLLRRIWPNLDGLGPAPSSSPERSRWSRSESRSGSGASGP